MSQTMTMNSNIDPASRRRPLIAALLSLIAPGLGQLYNSQYRRGLSFVGIAIVLNVIFYIASLSFVSSPRFSSLMFLLVFAAGAISIFIFFAIDAFLGARRETPGSLGGRYHFPVYFLLLVGWSGLQYAIYPDPLDKIEIYETASSSGIPNLFPGDRVVVWKDYHNGREPRRGDLAVFQVGLTGSESRAAGDWISRIIGIPGDEVQYNDGSLILNGQQVVRTDPVPFSYRRNSETEDASLFIEALSDGSRYRVIERENSGTRPKAKLFQVPPDHFFFLSDNRSHSIDSRIEKFVSRENAEPSAYVPRRNLRGRVIFVLFSRSFDRIGLSLEPRQ